MFARYGMLPYARRFGLCWLRLHTPCASLYHHLSCHTKIQGDDFNALLTRRFPLSHCVTFPISPWNIAARFDVDLSLPANGIEGMLASLIWSICYLGLPFTLMIFTVGKTENLLRKKALNCFYYISNQLLMASAIIILKHRPATKPVPI